MSFIPNVDISDYPVRRSRVITIQRSSEYRTLRGNADSHDRDKLYIGPANKGISHLSGLTSEEEKKYLPDVIGVSPTSPDWNKAVKKYWTSIHKVIPSHGLSLEIGFVYKTEKDADNDNEENGWPIDVNDFILYKYCLVYGRCARNKDLISLSPNKIKFYIEDPTYVEKEQFKISKLKQEAAQYYLDLIKFDKQQELNNILTLYGVNVNEMTSIQKINFVTNIGTSRDLEELNNFITICKDKNLAKRAYITRCLNSGLLKRIPNTDTLIYKDTITIGSSTDEAIKFIFNTEDGSKYKLEMDSVLDHINEKLTNTSETSDDEEKSVNTKNANIEKTLVNSK